VDFDQEQFLFVNVERIWGELIAAHEPMPGEVKTLAASLFGNTRAIASSTRFASFFKRRGGQARRRDRWPRVQHMPSSRGAGSQPTLF